MGFIITSNYPLTVLQAHFTAFNLHEGHPGITRMKSLTRLHIWWPSLDIDIESCVNCAGSAKEPTKVPLYQ